MLTKNDIHYLEIMILKIKKIKRKINCCNKRKDILLKKLLKEIFLTLQIEKQFNENFDFSILQLEKYIAKHKNNNINERIRIKSILKNLQNF